MQKGAALLEDMRQLVVEWDGTPECGERIASSNVLGHRSRARTRDVIARTFVPRYVRSVPRDLWRPLAVLERGAWSRTSLVPLHYYAAACAEPLVWDFVTIYLAGRYERGFHDVTPAEVLQFLAKAPASRFPRGRWSEHVSVKVARGLLAALRDFGVLAGATRKHISPVYLPTATFAMLARLRHEAGVRGRAAVDDPCWRLFYLSETAVERFFLEAHQDQLLGYHAAGSLVRVEFPPGTPEDYADALVARPH